MEDLFVRGETGGMKERGMKVNGFEGMKRVEWHEEKGLHTLGNSPSQPGKWLPRVA